MERDRLKLALNIGTCRRRVGRFEAAKSALERDDLAWSLLEVVEAGKSAVRPEERAEIGQVLELVAMAEVPPDDRARLEENRVAVDPRWSCLFVT